MNMEKSNIDFNEKRGFICDMDGVIYHGNFFERTSGWLFKKETLKMYAYRPTMVLNGVGDIAAIAKSSGKWSSRYSIMPENI